MSAKISTAKIYDKISAIIHIRLNYYLYLMDMVMLAMTAVVSYMYLDLSDSIATNLDYYYAVIIAMLMYSFFGFANGFYGRHGYRHHLKTPFMTFGGLIFSFGMLLLLGFFLQITNDYSRAWGLFWFLSFLFYVIASRLLLYWHLSQPNYAISLRRKAVILGAGENGQVVLDHMLRFDDGEIEVIGFLDDRVTRLPNSYRGIPLLGETALVENLVRDHGIDLIIMALPWKAHERIEELLKKLSVWRVDVFLAPDKLGLKYADRPVFRVGGMNILSIQDRPISEWNAVIKRIEDLVITIPAIILLLPLFIIVAIAIKIDSKGKVFFMQDRFGFNNDVIKVYKFRSIYEGMSDQKGVQQTSRDDPRVTNIGRILRKTSIDELPQLFNVLLGNMSIVGPRPHPTGMQAEGHLLHEVMAQYASRHRVKPGITGWAQCNGCRGKADTMDKALKRVEFDLFYIENWSVYLDLLVIYKTLKLLITEDDNAY